MVGRVLRGKKVSTFAPTAEKEFEIRYDMPCPALEAALHAQLIIWYFAVLFGSPFRFARADHMHTPVGGKAPSVLLGAPRALQQIPRLLRLLAGALLVLVLAGQLVRPAGCRFCRVPYRAVSCGSGGVRVGASVQCQEVSMAWLVLWCRCVSYGAAGWARRNTPMFAGRSLRACGSGTVSPWPIACSEEGSGKNKGIMVSVQAPLSFLDAVGFWGCGERVPHGILAGYMC